jgi:predicted lipoprotein with Yx(FWY)xxD motif
MRGERHDDAAAPLSRPRLRHRRVAALCALVLAASVGTVAAASGPAVAAGSKFTVHLATVKGLGKVLVDASDRTLYVFSKDKQGKPTCTSKTCVSFWPPLTISKAKKPTGGAGLNSKLLGTVKDPNGKLQVTYDRKPLYLLAGDKVGQANGEGITAFGGTWTAVNAKGKAVVVTTTTTTMGPTTSSSSTTPSSSTTTTTTGGGGYWA